jgi:hypothetical protein
MEDPRKLRGACRLDREFAERAGNPAIWDARLRTAKDLERGRSLGKDGDPAPRRSRNRSLSKTEDR